MTSSYAASGFAVLLPSGLLAVGALVVLLLEVAGPRARRACTAAGLATASLSALCLALLGESSAPHPGDALAAEVATDRLALAFAPAFYLALVACLVLAGPLLARLGRQRGEFQALAMFSASGMILLVQARDFLVFFLALETLSVPLYVLAGALTSEKRSVEAALKYFTMGALASAFVAFGIALTHGATGALGFDDVRRGLVGALDDGSASRVLMGRAGLACLLGGLAFKVGLVPLHAWAPDVYQGAPTPVTALLAVGSKAAGFAGLTRVLVEVFPPAPGVASVLALLAAASMIVGSCAAVLQDDVKRLLAYSGIAHAGFIAMALAAHVRLAEAGLVRGDGAAALAASPAVAAVTFYVVAYALMTGGALAIVAIVEGRYGERTAVLDYRGLAARRPFLAAALLACLLSMGGMPPLAGFLAKWLAFRAAVEADLFWLAVVAALASVLAFFYYLRVVVQAYLRPAAEEEARPVQGRGALAVVLFCVVLTIFLGLVPGVLLWGGSADAAFAAAGTR